MSTLLSLEQGNQTEKCGVFVHTDQDRQNLSLSISRNYITNQFQFCDMLSDATVF
jgi:hypothetical protein